MSVQPGPGLPGTPSSAFKTKKKPPTKAAFSTYIIEESVTKT